ncbi:MAG: tetratricopeptide repeat protein [Endomicrobium sp.]|jgi:tol-pal system protein YbgF|nr:tetratricopeptide repeat protein [Endomicrobium sp.]
MKRSGLFLIVVSAFILSGCVAPMVSQQNISDLRGEVAQLQIQFNELQKNHADLYAKADTEFVSLDAVNAAIADLQNRLSVLTQTVGELKSAVKKVESSERAEAVLPSDLYQNSYSDFSMAKYDLAYQGFKSFLDKYPNAELAAQAQFYMGECLYSKKQWQKALEEYMKIEGKYKKSDLIATARLKTALCYEQLGKPDDAMNIFGSIVKDFPQSSESLTAKDRIRKYNNAQNRQQ